MTLELEKEQVIQTLCAHYAQDHLSTHELEARFEKVYRSPDRATLNTVLHDLPAVGPLLAPPTPLYGLAPQHGAAVEASRRYLGFFAQINKEGHWRPARHSRAVAILGGVTLDLREAQLPAEGLDIEVEVFMGEVKVLLPPGIGADVDCTAFMAEVKDRTHAGTLGAPTVRVRGGAIMGTIVVVTKFPKKERMESWRAQLKKWFGTDADE